MKNNPRLLSFLFGLAIGIIICPLFSSSSLAQQEPVEEEEDVFQGKPFPPYDPDGPMQFYAAWNGATSLFGNPFWISAQGRITKDTPQEFRKFLAEDFTYNDIKKALESIDHRLTDVFLHSCGGDEDAAMELGRIFQEMKFDVRAGQTYPPLPEDHELYSETGSGECQGACILAALGGHTFSLDSLSNLKELDHGNGTIGDDGVYFPITLKAFQSSRKKIMLYAHERGVDIKRFAEFLPRDPSKKRILTFADAAEISISLGFTDMHAPPEEYQKPCRP